MLNSSASADDFEIFEARIPFATPKTAKGMIKTKSYLDLLKNDIHNFCFEIETLSESNATSRIESGQLTEHIAAISKGLEDNIILLKESNDTIKNENLMLQNNIKRQNELMNQISNLCTELSSLGINLRNYPEIDHDFLTSLLGEEIKVDQNSLNSEIISIINSNSYFKKCKSNEEFINKCAELYQMTGDNFSFRLPKFEGNSYSGKIQILQKYHNETHAHFAEEIKVLMKEKDELVRDCRRLDLRKSSKYVKKHS